MNIYIYIDIYYVYFVVVTYAGIWLVYNEKLIKV